MYTRHQGKSRPPRENSDSRAKELTLPRKSKGFLRTRVGLAVFHLKTLSRETCKKREKTRLAVLAWQSAAVVALFRCFVPLEHLTLQDSENCRRVSNCWASFSRFCASVHASMVCMLEGCVLDTSVPPQSDAHAHGRKMKY